MEFSIEMILIVLIVLWSASIFLIGYTFGLIENERLIQTIEEEMKRIRERG